MDKNLFEANVLIGLKGGIDQATDPFYRDTPYIDMANSIKPKINAIESFADFISTSYFIIFNAKAKSAIIIKKFAKFIEPSGEWFLKWKDIFDLPNNSLNLFNFVQNHIFKSLIAYRTRYLFPATSKKSAPTKLTENEDQTIRYVAA